MKIPLEEERNCNDELRAKIQFQSRNKQQHSNIYKIPFTYALNLVETMKFFIHKGYIYVSREELEQVVENVFKENLLKKLSSIYKYLDKILSDTRIANLIRDLEARREQRINQIVQKISSENQISIKDIEGTYEQYLNILLN
jgi:DNA primase large subunit